MTKVEIEAVQKVPMYLQQTTKLQPHETKMVLVTGKLENSIQYLVEGDMINGGLIRKKTENKI